MPSMKQKAGNEPLIGAHMSIAGGAWRAFERLAEVGGNCLQVFVKSNVQWAFPKVTDEDVERFARARAETKVRAVFAHGCYLANLATADRTIRRRSVADVRKELRLAGRYGIGHLVLHPGNHRGAGPAEGIERVARGLRGILEETAGGAGILLETTAGAGTAVASRLEEIAEIIEKAGGDARLGVCIDTAHMFAAGYDIRNEAGYREAKRRLRALGLLKRVRLIHVNDSKSGLGSRVDRHEQIGRGKLGREAFRRIMADRDFAKVPKILETPKGMCGRRKCDAVNIAVLKRLAAKQAGGKGGA